MSDVAQKYAVSAAAVEKFLTGDGEFLPPQSLLGDLTEAQAMAVPAGSFYSIAQIVAHMHFWQERNIARARGEVQARPEHLDDTFPLPQAGEWDSLRSGFLNGLERCAAVAAEKADATSADQGERSIGYELAQCPALHSAYHYGQIAMLRQIQNLWPPEGGDGGW